MNNSDAPELQSIWEEAKGHADRGEYDKAVEIYRYILLRYSDNSKAVEYANAYVGDIFLTIRLLDLAEKHLKKAIVVSPETAHYHYLLGFAYSIRERWAKAVAAFRKALRLQRDNSEYERGLGWAMFSGGERIEGMSHLFKALELSPTDVNVITDVGAAMLVLGDISRAKEYAQKAVGLDPNYEPAKSILEVIKQIGRKA